MKIGIVIGSVRDGRIGAHVARWVQEHAEGREAAYEVIDLKEFDLPICASARVAATSNRKYDDERVTLWSHAIDACDGFVFVTPEYNHGIPGGFKNAFDWIFPEWWSKSVAFVSYGSGYGFRAIEQWRLVVATANMFDIKAQLTFSTVLDFEGDQFKPADRQVGELINLFKSLETATLAMSTLRD